MRSMYHPIELNQKLIDFIKKNDLNLNNCINRVGLMKEIHNYLSKHKLVKEGIISYDKQLFELFNLNNDQIHIVYLHKYVFTFIKNIEFDY